GSDAIGGVVNFITRRSYDGLELSGDYRWIDGSDGDYGGSILWGKTGSNWDVMASAGYHQRSELPVLGHDWAHQAYENNPRGRWTGGRQPAGVPPRHGGRHAHRRVPARPRLHQAGRSAHDRQYERGPSVAVDELPRAVLDLGQP